MTILEKLANAGVVPGVVLDDAASAVDTYVTQLRNKMNSAQGEVNNMSSIWQGSDYTRFKSQWNKVTSGDSTYSEMVKSLEAYSKFLKYAAEKYKDAQTKAVNRANSLPRW